MTRNEFLQKLEEALQLELDSHSVQENINYYDNYIWDEMNSGKSEEEVMGMLGDPWIIARSIIDSPGGPDNESYRGFGNTQRIDPYSVNNSSQPKELLKLNWWKLLLGIVAVIGCIALVFAIIGGIISLVAPVVVPILVVVLILRFFQNRR